MRRGAGAALAALGTLGWFGVAAAAAQEAELELDLTAPETKVPEALKPSLAILAVASLDADPLMAERAGAIEASLQELIGQSQQYRSVVSPAGAAGRLGPRAARFQGCTDYACFEEAIGVLEVDRAVRVTVEPSGGGTLVTLQGFDAGFSAVVTVSEAVPEGLGSRAKRVRDLVQRLTPFLRNAVSRLATPNGRIDVRCKDPGATVSVDGLTVGMGPTELIAQRGRHAVRVTSAGALPFEATVDVRALETARVDVQLVPRPPAPVEPLPLVPVPLARRPGLYVAAGGLVAAVTGVALGQVASGVAARMNVTADPLPVTRTEAKAAAAEATLANVLVPLGLAAMVGGGAWFFLQPPTPSAAPPVLGGGREQ